MGSPEVYSLRSTMAAAAAEESRAASVWWQQLCSPWQPPSALPGLWGKWNSIREPSGSVYVSDQQSPISKGDSNMLLFSSCVRGPDWPTEKKKNKRKEKGKGKGMKEALPP